MLHMDKYTTTTSDQLLSNLIDRTKTERITLTLDQQEALTALDSAASMDKALRACDLEGVVGVLAGIKPSTIVNSEIGGLVAGYGVKREHIEGLGLSYNEPEDGQFAISRHQELADALSYNFVEGIWNNAGDRNQAHVQIGRLLGYPATATNYFIERLRSIDDTVDKQLPIIEPKILQGTTSEKFCNFILSPTHWRQEIDAYVLPLEQAMREFAPITYKVIENEVNRRRMINKIRRFVGMRAVPSRTYSQSVAIQVVS